MALKYQGYLKYRHDILVEYTQCKNEGKMVEQYRTLVDEFCKRSADELSNMEDALICLADQMINCPTDPAYPYVEPSDYAGILAASPSAAGAPVFTDIPTGNALREKLTGAWIGRIAGCLLGKPIEGWTREGIYDVLKATDNFPLKRYLCKGEFSKEIIEKHRIYTGANCCFADNLKNTAPSDDDTNYTVFSMKLIEHYGKNFTPDDVLEAWLQWIPCFATFTAERVAYRNAAMGLLPPETATYRNPYREYIGAQIRGDFFGYINPGNPGEAVRMAFNDASISHVKNGIYGELFISAMIAAAACTSDIREIIETGLAYIPAKSRLTADIREVMGHYESGMDAYAIIEKIHERFDEHAGFDWCYTNSNAMIVATALLCGEGDFGKSICYAVHAGFDTDCNGATVGSILGMRNGEADIDPYWIAPFNKNLSTSIEGYNQVTVDEMVEKTMALIGENAGGNSTSTIQYAP